MRSEHLLGDSLKMRILAALVLTLMVGLYVGFLIACNGCGQKTGAEGSADNTKRSGEAGGLLMMGFYSEDYPGDNSSWDSLERNIESLDWVSPFWYSIDAEGKVNNRGGDRGKAIELAKGKGVKVLGLFNNQGGTDVFLQRPSVLAVAVRGIVDTVEAEGLDGVNIDFESLEPDSREGLTRFVAALHSELHQIDKVVTVSVFPKWTDDEISSEWSYAYDYHGLSESSDYLVIMAYDQHGAWSGPGPVASSAWVDRALEYALKMVPARQLILGIAGYGYDWGGGDVRPVMARDALALAQRWKSEVIRDDSSGTQRFVYYNRGIKHQVWWEDAESVSNKVNLARANGLAGVALWRLGQEEQRLWSIR